MQAVEAESDSRNQHASAKSVSRTWSMLWTIMHKVLYYILKCYSYKIRHLPHLKPQEQQQKNGKWMMTNGEHVRFCGLIKPVFIYKDNSIHRISSIIR